MKRREPPVLCFTVPEAAEAIRLSENTLRVWVKQGIVRVVRWNNLDLVPRVELERLIDDALANNGSPIATPSASPDVRQSGFQQADGIGVGGPAVELGEVPASRPPTPTTNKPRRAGQSARRGRDSAAL